MYRSNFSYILLLLSLVGLKFFPLEVVLQFPFVGRVFFTGILIGTPLFFASLVFSYSFRKAIDTATAFGSNLMGIVVSGALEYSNMIYGLNSLYVLAVAMYFLVMLADRDALLNFRLLAKPAR